MKTDECHWLPWVFIGSDQTDGYLNGIESSEVAKIVIGTGMDRRRSWPQASLITLFRTSLIKFYLNSQQK